MKKTIYLLIFVIMIGLSQTSVIGAPGDLLLTFLNPDPDENDHFGESIAAVGDNILVGVVMDSNAATWCGVAYLFDSNGVLLRTFENPTPDSYDFFGERIATVGNNILISAHGDDWGSNDGGAVYLFEPNGTLLHTFNNPTQTDGDGFGLSLAAVGSNIIIGAIGMNNETGVVYLFDGSTYDHLQTFNNPTPEAQEQFGFSVAAMGNNILIGCKYHNTDTIDKVGAAYLFEPNGTLLTTFDNPEPNEYDQFGCSISAIGNNIIIGADGDDNATGIAYLFDMDGSLLSTFQNPDGGYWFGSSIAVLAGNVLIGARGYDNFTGAVYLFDADGNLLHTFPNPDPHEHDSFGGCVAMMGSNALIGAAWNDTGASGTGAAYLFEGYPLGDFEPDGDVDFTDFAFLANYWTDSGLGPYGGADLAGDGAVDINDLCEFTGNWLRGK